jgi:putative transposase
MKLVEQHVIKRGDPRYQRLDAAAFASKNLWNAANYLVRQSFIFGGVYLNNTAVFHLIKEHEAYQALPRKVSNQVFIQLHKAWVGFKKAMDAWREHPERFTGRPNLPGYKHKTEGRNLLVYEKGAIWKGELDQGVIAVTELGTLVPTAQNRETVCEVRIVPKGDQYVIEVVYQQEAKQASVDPALFVAVDLGVSVLAALTSNKPGFIPRLVSGRPIKSRNQYYNKRRTRSQRRLAQQNRFPSRQLDRMTTKRNRRIMHDLHTARRRINDLLVSEAIGLLIIGKNPLWKQDIELGKRNNQHFVLIPHARLIELLTYKAELVVIRVILPEESYTSRASFLDRDEIPVYDPERAKEPRFSGRRDGRWYYASGKRIIHSDVNGSYNICRKVVPTAFDGPGIAAPAVCAQRGALPSVV